MLRYIYILFFLCSAGLNSQPVDCLGRDFSRHEWLKEDTTGILENEPVDNGLILLVSPNPASDEIKILFSNDNTTDKGILTISDLRGIEVQKSKELKLSKGKNEVIISSVGLSSGVYIIKIELNDKILSEKVIIAD